MTSAQIKAPVLVPQSSLLGQDLRHYIVRPGNIMIPLIPVDQLPFQLQGIPRQLNHQQMFEGGWKFIQETKESAKPLPIQAPTKVEPSQPKFLPPDYKVRAEAVEPPTTVVNIINPQNTTPWSSPSVAKPTFEESLPVRRIPTTMADRFMANQNPSSTNFVVDKWRQTQESNNARRLTPPAMADHQVSLSESFASIYPKDAQRYNYRVFPPSGVEPDPSKKEFCTHWIKTGECAFTATGCRYKHEMPPIDKLRELGFTSQPKWWKDKSAIRTTPTWMQRRVNQDNEEESKSIAEAPTQRVFNPANFRKYKRENSDPQLGLTILKYPEIETERNILNKENEREAVESLTSYRITQVIPNLIDVDEVDIPAPPLSLEQSTNTSSDSDSTADSSYSQSSVAPSHPPSPRLDIALVDLQEAMNESPRCVRRHSEISWSSNDGKIHKQYPKRNAPLKKVPAPRITPTFAVSKKAGLAKSRYASKAKEGDGAAKNNGQERKGGREVPAAQDKKTRKRVPSLQSQITKLVRTTRDREGRRRNTAGQNKGTPSIAPTEQAADIPA